MIADAVRTYNIIEGFYWLGISLVFFVPALRSREKNRLFCLLGGLAFVSAALSEFCEVHTGAWWKPWWLLVWKISFGPVFILMVIWYRKIKMTESPHSRQPKE